jgi:hypothetical protein
LTGLVAYFGYGSLVNRATHRTAIVDAFPARLRNWRRLWRPRPDMPGFPAALLTIRPEEGCWTDGLLVIDHADNLAAIDAREARYDRVALDAADLDIAQPLAPDIPAYVYVAQEHLPVHPAPPMILRSYLDAVLQGFLEVHGEAGVARFLSETEGFDFIVHEDAEAPVYPRAVKLAQAQRATLDALLRVRFPPGSGVE